MSCFARAPAVIAVLIALGAAAGGHAQGTKEDYARALGWTDRVGNRVYRQSVRPVWQEGGTSFWYRIQTGASAYEFVHVDALAGARRPAFDQAKVAAELSRALGRAVPASDLPLGGFSWPRAGEPPRFTAGGKTWEIALPDGVVRPAAGPLEDGENGQNHARSSRTGRDTSILFINRNAWDARLEWVNAGGRPEAYGVVAAGGRREQHTFSGHAWRLSTPAGELLGVYVAEDDRIEVDIPATPRKPRPRPEGPRAPRFDSARSPDGRWEVAVRDHNLVLRDLKGEGRTAALTKDGAEGDGYDLPAFWSPDSARLVALRTRRAPPRQITLVESSPSDQVQPKMRTINYPKPGDPIDHPRPHLFAVPEMKEIPVADALFPNPWEIDPLRWTPDGREFLFVYNPRGHQVLRVVGIGRDGAARAVVNEECRTYFDYAQKFLCRYLERTGEILWMSERSGWNHLWLYDAAKGAAKNPVTRGEWVVREVLHVDEDARQVWFLCGGVRPDEDPYHAHLARANFDGSGFRLLTEGRGVHRVTFSPDRKYFLDRWSRVDQPPVTELRAAADGRLVCELERGDWSDLLRAGWRPPERFAAKGRDGKTDIWGVIRRPSTFDPARKYPVIESIYAGPQDAFAPVAFSLGASEGALAELGFVVVEIDGMGTSLRSKAFHDVSWRNLGDGGFPDRIAWMKAAAATRPWMDLARVGVYGGSAGGQNALRALLAHGDFYRAAVADCGCHDNRMDKIWWNELYMGWPVGPHYAEQSNVTQAHKLQGKLLLVVGELDDNVDPSSTMQVVNALIRADKDFELLVVPGGGHGAGDRPYGRRRRMDFFVRHLLGVEPRR